MSFESPSEIVPPTTLPSPLHAIAAETLAPPREATRPVHAWGARRRAARRAVLALAFDAAILAAMLALAWELFTPWSQALDAANGLMALGLVACGGLWAAFVRQDLRRWRRLRSTRRGRASR